MATHLGSFLRRNFQIYQVFGANTNVGKTIFSTLLCRTAQVGASSRKVWYLKPVSTGPLDDADRGHLDRFAHGVYTQNFYQFDAAVSPHIAAQEHNIPDSTILEKLSKQIHINAQHGPGFMLVETAGGPHSPGPSGTSQADLFRPLRIPTIFVADWRLGGVSTSISSWEALKMRGYDVEGVAVFKDTQYQNYDYFQQYFRDRDVPVLTLPLPPPQSETNDHLAMSNYYSDAEAYQDPEENEASLARFTRQLSSRHKNRLDRLQDMSAAASSRIWYPFTQHQDLNPKNLTVIDSAHGGFFQTLVKDSETPQSHNDSALRSSFDGSASWWTQGLGHANKDLTAAAAYAAGRYGHVMFAEAIHEPALDLAEKLLQTLGNPRLSRVFYSDNGSTGIEVGLKMALKASVIRYGWQDQTDIEIIGLKNSYHGDTIGAMDMSEPSVFNKKVPWYSGRGFWFDCPTVVMRKGSWLVEKPELIQEYVGSTTEHASLADIFDPGRDHSEEAAAYEKYIRQTFERLTLEQGRSFGALVMEPVVLGAGGMMLVDPLFQRTLVKVVRSSANLFSPSTSPPKSDPSTATTNGSWTGLPILFDEVFSGLYRLGHRTASSLLHIDPDISVHAKLLTGGLLPLAATAASESIFSASLSPHKADALLHGHSYTAHPIGCAVAVESLNQLRRLDEGAAWDAFRADWARHDSSSSSSSSSIGAEIIDAIKDVANSAVPASTGAKPSLTIWSVWSTSFLNVLSHSTSPFKVAGVWALGSVLSIQLHDEDGAGGYASNVARALQQRLLADVEGTGWNVHARVLGNVLYLMTSQVCEEGEVRALEGRVRGAMGL